MQGYSPKLPLIKDSQDGLFTMNKTALESIKQDFKMLLLTNPGERMMLPDYGVGIKKYLFEQKVKEVNTQIISRINSQVANYMKFLKITNIEISEMANSEVGINLKISYYINNFQNEDQINLLLMPN